MPGLKSKKLSKSSKSIKLRNAKNFNPIKLGRLKLSSKESGDIIKFLARKRGISSRKMLDTINKSAKKVVNSETPVLSLNKASKDEEKQNLALVKVNELPKKLNKTIFGNLMMIKTIRNKLKSMTHRLSHTELKKIKNHLHIIRK